MMRTEEKSSVFCVYANKTVEKRHNNSYNIINVRINEKARFIYEKSNACLWHKA